MSIGFKEYLSKQKEETFEDFDKEHLHDDNAKSDDSKDQSSESDAT